MSKDETTAITPRERAKAIQMFFRFGREYPAIFKQFKAGISFHDFFDFQEIMLKKLDFSDINKVKDWIDLALSDINASVKLYKTEDGLALYHLQQGIEKLMKASLIFTGFKTETNVITLNHKPQEFAIEMLNDPDFDKALFQQFPFKSKGIKRPVKPSDEKIKKLKNLITTSDKIQALNTGDGIVEGVTTILDHPHPVLYDPDEFGELTKDMMESIIPKRELTKFINKCNAGSISYDDMVYLASNYCFIAVNMALILLPLSIGTWAFQSVPRYPDELRKLGDRKFEDFEAHKAFYTIINQVQKFGECFKKFLS